MSEGVQSWSHIPKGVRADKMTPHIARGSTRESGSCTLPELPTSHSEDKSIGELALPIMSHVVIWRSERYSPAPPHLQQEGELVLVL